MGTIQNSFNQLLGIAAIGSKVVGAEIGEHKANQVALQKEGAKLDKEMTVAQEEAKGLETNMQTVSNEIEDVKKNGMPNYVGDKRRKEYRDAKNEYLDKKQAAYDELKKQYEDKETQVSGFAERVKLLKEKEYMEEARFKKGLFGLKGAQKKSEAFNKEVDEIVGGKK